ncbi:MAG: translation elongation factor Ts [Desulfovibrionaceae bacterium]|jgi:elongation factor Ts|nr:translation elongation factor Ts [Desulfovibrionaceae bacterium]
MAISAQQVKALRDKTGAGMMDCKKALAESGGDEQKAIDWLRKKGIAKAAKRADREASEGVIGNYIHSNGKIGVMVEVKCETDFVAKSDKFQEFAKNVAMQIAAASPLCVSPDELPSENLEREKEIYRQQGLQEGKPAQIVEKIVEGRVKKYYKEVCLLEQAYIRDDKLTIQDLVNELVAVLGENIQIGRFVRMQLGAE